MKNAEGERVSGGRMKGRSGRLREVMHEATDALGELADVEVHQESDATAGELQVREELGLVDRADLVDGLQLDDHLALDPEVDPVSAVDPHSSVDDRQLQLLLDGQAPLPELEEQAALVSRL